jgi:hypothetical protein
MEAIFSAEIFITTNLTTHRHNREDYGLHRLVNFTAHPIEGDEAFSIVSCDFLGKETPFPAANSLPDQSV